MSQILMRRIYEHVTGKLFITMMIAEPLKSGDPQQVVLSSLDDASISVSPVSTFFDKHPQTQVPRFQLVQAVVKK